MSDNSFKITLKAARVNAGYKQKDAAKLLGIGNGRLVRWEQNPEQIPGEWIAKLCDLYGVSTDRVIFLP